MSLGFLVGMAGKAPSVTESNFVRGRWHPPMVMVVECSRRAKSRTPSPFTVLLEEELPL
ncbi:hypothetical protein J5X98_02720 [Leptothermofonsia sichuanensis E412]|uniref:hypothetical protein n=1 Tax=Leptothermofonsia sichuanensis TaxID=2917832 RepID=UPI001CA6F03E|nr:hypothetical protein [Leptothermofonsia sichuanensis]QZZ21410.1 hypothetical protein J5X98_02720 [Leptothermofonsia sichuanensis E412]